MPPFELSRLAVPAVLLLIFFLAYSSQYLFLHLEPRPLTSQESVWFNVCLAALLICYYRSVKTDPGFVPRRGIDDNDDALAENEGLTSSGRSLGHRFCRKCNRVKPPRAHHCRNCQKCIPKMDHHCPWTTNCVSHTTFPHFIRFLFFAVVAMGYLATFLYTRLAVIWSKRSLPYYLGPAPLHLAHLFLLSIVNTLTLSALIILLIRSLWCLAVNTTTIEGWEIERHEALVARARKTGNVLFSHNGQEIKIVKQEFPYDIGIWQNIVQGMGSSIPLLWLWPFASTPSTESGLQFPTNGFEDESTTWPPPDPDRIASAYQRAQPVTNMDEDTMTNNERLEAFKSRQLQDFRYRGTSGVMYHESIANSTSEPGEAHDWRNAEGEKLADFGLDEETEFYDEDIPLSEIIARKKGK